MKKIIIALLALALLTPAALAVSRDEAVSIAQRAANGAEVTRVERDGGVYEVELRGDGARYRVDVRGSSGAVLEVEELRSGAGGAAEFALSDDEARAAAASVAPEAAGGIVTRERDTQGCTYEVFYAGIGAAGEISVNAETGAIVSVKTYPAAAERGVLSDARVAELLDAKLPGALIAELELDWDGGRYVYEGEALANGLRYSFEMDASSGAFLELERDD